MRPDRLVVVCGTGTAVGKTWVTARLAERARVAGRRVAARKPVQSFAPGEGPTDADVLAAATAEEPARVCPLGRWYEAAMAPPMAAEALGRPPFGVGELADELSWPDGVELGLVETVGGVRSPVAADGDSAALAAALGADLLVLVADAGLGTINAVRLSVEALAPLPPVVFLNRFDGGELHRRNLDWLARDGFDVTCSLDDLAARMAEP